MQQIPEGFFQDDIGRAYNAFLRLAAHMCDLRQVLNECSQVAAEPAEWDLKDVASQIFEQIDTLEFMARDAGKYWGEIQHDIAKAAGSLNLDRPADNVSWCHSTIHIAWQTWKRLSRQRHRDPADRVRAFAKLADSLPDFDDRATWENRIAKEFRAMAANDRQRTIEQQKPRSPQCTIPQWLKAFRDAKAFFGEQRKFEGHMKALGKEGIAHKPTPKASWAIELWYLEQKGIKVPQMI